MASPVIELYPGAEDSPFASMMLALIRQNLADRPEKLSDFERMRGRVCLVAEDIDAAATLRFQAGKLSVHRDIFGIPDLAIRGESGALVDMSRVPPHARFKMLPDPQSAPAQALFEALKTGKLKVHGLLSHVGLAVRFAKLMSVY